MDGRPPATPKELIDNLAGIVTDGMTQDQKINVTAALGTAFLAGAGWVSPRAAMTIIALLEDEDAEVKGLN